MVELVEQEVNLKKDQRPFHEEVFPLIDRNIKKFTKIIQAICHFHLLFALSLFAEFSLVSALFSLDPHSVFLPFSLALFFFTIFAYLTLNIYNKGKKSYKFLELLDGFILECQEFIPYDWEELEYHTSMSFGLRKFAEQLSNQDNQKFHFLKINMSFLFSFFKKELFTMKELLLQAVVQEHIEMVKIDPQNVEVHASLANAYVLLSMLYTPFPKEFKQVIAFAIEEFEIVKEYAPNDPWVYTQLAFGWKELNMVEKEIESYETIVSLRPGDLDSLFYLGTLYFSSSRNAKGLQIYENLRRLDERKAMELIGYYGKSISERNPAG
jgi:tetratricopeptide (TPR) repeat protein